MYMNLCEDECVSESICVSDILCVSEGGSVSRAWALLWNGESRLREGIPLAQEYTVTRESDSSLEREGVSSPWGWVQGREADVGTKGIQ